MTKPLTRPQLVMIGAIGVAMTWFSVVACYWWMIDPRLPTSKVVKVSILWLIVVSAPVSAIVVLPAATLLRNASGWIRLMVPAVVWLAATWWVVHSLGHAQVVADRVNSIGMILGLSGAFFGPSLAPAFFVPWRLRQLRLESQRRCDEMLRKSELERAAQMKKHEAWRAKHDADKNERERQRALRNYFRS